MIYYKDHELIIRDMKQEDAQALTGGEREQGWHTDMEKFEMRLRDASAGKSVALVAEYNGAAVGYLNVYLHAEQGVFAGQGYPELVDFGVLMKYRKNGIGSKLMDVAERIASRYADVVCLGVGLHSGYGSAQRMYVKRGYVPDGSGVWYGSSVGEQYAECCNDDDLVLYMAKKLI